MVDADIVRRKTSLVLHHVARLRGRASLAPSQLRSDEDLYNNVLMDLQQAIQACIDLAVHACVDDALGAPAGPAQAFALLARAGRIDDALAVRLAGAAGLRNLIVHRYGELDAATIVQVIKRDLDDLVTFIRAFAGGDA